MRNRLYVFSLLICFLASTCSGGCDPNKEVKTADYLEDTPLESYQLELLDIAFSAASAMPVFPHIKNRSLTQETVVTACFELNQPLRALGYIEQIDNWRRGAGYADSAFYCAQRGFKDEAESNLKMAIKISEESDEWRKDRIKVKISQAYAYLKQAEAAAKFERDIEASETGKVARVEAMICPADSYDEKMADIQRLALSENFDIVKNALVAYVELYNRFYTDKGRRKIIEEKIKTSWNNMPITVRIDLLIELVNFSLAHGDKAKALELIDEAVKIMDSIKWLLRFGIPLTARLAELRFLAGDKEPARTKLQDALNMFDTNQKKIVNIYRAGILRTIAEAYQTMGDTDTARNVYKRAFEAGIENPNSRPRAEDLAATCCSMALHAVVPGAELSSRIREIHDGLGDPW